MNYIQLSKDVNDSPLINLNKVIVIAPDTNDNGKPIIKFISEVREHIAEFENIVERCLAMDLIIREIENFKK